MDTTIPNYKGELNLELPIGYEFSGKYVKDVELLTTNGIAEKVFLKKYPEKPYTWIANVLSVAIGKLGDNYVGGNVRETYMKTDTVEIPQIILNMPLADANTLLVEIHRRVWHNLIKNQEIICKYCTKSLHADIDLSRIEMSEENLQKMKEAATVIDMLQVDLDYTVDVKQWLTDLKKTEEYPDMIDQTYNQLIFRLPTMRDCIQNEKYAANNVDFWRRISFNCLVDINAIDRNDNNHKASFIPHDMWSWLGLKLFDKYLVAEDLRKIRTAIREEAPTLGFSYKETCFCDRAKEIPFSMEASSFFSE